MADPMIFFAGAELESMILASGSYLSEAGEAWHDPAFSQVGISINGNSYRVNFSDDAGAPQVVSDGETLHVMGFINLGAAGTASIVTVFDENGRPAFRLFRASSPASALQAEHNTGVASPVWTTVQSFPAFTRGYFAASFKMGAVKEVTLFALDNFIGTSAVVNAAIAPLSYATLGSSNSTAYISQIGFSRDIPLVGGRIRTIKPTADGAVQEMTGSYTALAKTAINDATAVVASAGGETSTFEYADYTIPAGLEVASVFVTTRARVDGVDVMGLQTVCRSAATDYASDVELTVSGYAPLVAQYPRDPATGLEWTSASISAAEFGLVSS